MSRLPLTLALFCLCSTGCSVDQAAIAPAPGAPPPDASPRPDSATCAPGTVDANGDPSDGCECTPTAPSDELCDGFDNDCDPTTMDGIDDPGIGVACDGADDDLCEEGMWLCIGGRAVCEDTTGNTNEACNDLDDDCDGVIDEEAGTRYHRDDDGDGYGLDDDFVFSCVPLTGREPRGGDCDDSNDLINPSRPEMCDGRDDNCNGTIDEGGGCECVGYVHEARLYSICTVERNWYDARDRCRTRTGHDLARLDTDAEDAFVVMTLRSLTGAPAWVGLHDEDHEGDWRWADEDPIGREAWGPGEPNNDDGSCCFNAENCGVVAQYPDPRTWNDRNCDRGHHYVCEGPPP